METNFKELIHGIELEEKKELVKFNGKYFYVKKDISSQDRADIVDIAIQRASYEGYINLDLLHHYIILYTFYAFTDIKFSDEDRENELSLLDKIRESGLLLAASSAENSYFDTTRNSLINKAEQTAEYKMEYDRSLMVLLNGLLRDLPEQAKAAQEILSGFDKEQFQNVIDFAKEANGGRDIESK